MRITKYLCLLLIFYHSILYAQDDLLNTSQKLLSFQQAKFSIGGGLEGGGAYFNGSLPSGYQFKKDTSTYLASGFLIFDIDAPNSHLSFTSGVEYSNQGFIFINDSKSFIKNFRIQQINIPFYIKFKMGGKFAKNNLILLAGGAYTIPVSFSNRDDFGRVNTDISLVQNNYAWIGGLVWQMNLRGKAREVYSHAPPRIWLYLKYKQMLNNLFNPKYGGEVLGYFGEEKFEYKDSKLVFGIAYLFGSTEKHQVK